MTFSPTVLGTGPAGYAFLTRTRETQQNLLAKSSEVARETQKFLSDLKDVQTSDQLLDDRALLKVALGAFGLDEDLNNRAFIKGILDSDLTDGTSMANRLADKRYLALARTFNFAGEGGPKLGAAKSADDVSLELANIQTADELLGNAPLLRATLSSFGLEKDVGNTFFLKSVLESDLTNPSSFANRLSDPRYGELAAAFDLAEKTRRQDSIYGFAQLVTQADGPIETAQDLLDNDALFTASLEIFGLGKDINRPEFITAVLGSDLGDPASVANQQTDERYVALAKAFGFAERADEAALGNTYESRIESFAETVSARTTRIEKPDDLFADPALMLETFKLFDLPSRADSVPFTSRILNSDPDSPTSLINVFPDPRYRAFSDALGLRQEVTERTYPAGFAEAIVEDYLNRQFEIRVGETDPTMRFALAMERDLNQIVDATSGNDSRWFAVMASGPLREVFETAFQLPSSFAQLDIDRQLGDLKARSERFFGTANVADYIDPDNMEELRQRYLVRSGAEASQGTSSGNIVLALLGGG